MTRNLETNGKKMMRGLVILIAAGLMGGCTAPGTLYEWGGYPSGLTSYTKSGDAEQFEEELREAIAQGEGEGRVPPGIYAELGYLLMNTERPGEALVFFEREKQAFPEAAVLMDKMIIGARRASEEETANAS